MTIVSLVGDCTTTTALALASMWPAGDRVTVVEADPTGGSLSAWLDTPRLPSLATVVAGASRATIDQPDAPTIDRGMPRHSIVEAIDSMTHRPSAGIAFVAAPTPTVAAARAVEEAGSIVFPALGRSTQGTALVDAGRHPTDLRPHPTLGIARTIVVVHRQDTASSRAAAVRLERHVEWLERLADSRRMLLPVVIGDRPFEPDEIDGYVRSILPGSDVWPHHVLADDALAAAVLAGREGVSERRLRRLPLMRSAATLAARLVEVDGQVDGDVER